MQLSPAGKACRDDLLRPRPSGHRFQPSGSDDVASISSVPSLLCLLGERRDGLTFSRSSLGRELLATRPPRSDRQRAPDRRPESSSTGMMHLIGASESTVPRSRSASLVTRRASSPTTISPFRWDLAEADEARADNGTELSQKELDAMDCMRGRSVNKHGKHDAGAGAGAAQPSLSRRADQAVFKFSPRTYNSLRNASSGGSNDQRAAVLKSILASPQRRPKVAAS